MLNAERQQEVITLCQHLVQCKSYSGEEGSVAEVLKNYFQSHGFDAVSVDNYGNCLGYMQGTGPGPTILLDGHMDTVPVTEPESWDYPPFGAEIHDGKIHGRGTSDMKGALAAMCCSVANFAIDNKKNFAGNIYVAGVVHEECFEGVAARSISKLVKPDYVIIGEASGLNIKIGQRGRAEVKLEVFGKPAHSANPEKGINAVYKICKLVEAIRKLPVTRDPFLGEGILELTDIKSSPYPGASVVPEYCMATYDRRLLTGESKKSVLAPLEKLVAQLSAEDSKLQAKVSYAQGAENCYTGHKIQGERFFPGWVFPKDALFVEAAVRELEEKGYTPTITKYNFCTNGSHYAGEAGIKTIGLGPSRENLAHTKNEYIEIEELTKAADCYYGVLQAWTKLKE
ncbi:MAG: YgeY family selenium metabolism-linked hydrolase [Acidaminococcaceae bacterium]|jgi:putative selenium metabolism hydrolase|nr:YgeY family selenium metabolism-linked hydrolase [Acidaminococcaceae bacterium]MCI2109838.1 YgeY family selenium metabolism-linked hydrolase [Acidaminococcaceae bacterium]